MQGTILFQSRRNLTQPHSEGWGWDWECSKAKELFYNARNREKKNERNLTGKNPLWI